MEHEKGHHHAETFPPILTDALFPLQDFGLSGKK